ncbi:MAG: hypothetical protein ACRD0A_06810 [Acidimicrobiales bacterium]
MRGPFGKVSAVERDLFEALVRVRLALEPEGWAVAVQGARLDVYPSPQGRRVRGAEHVYPVDPAASPIRSVMIFDDADVSGLATVEEQAAHWEAYVGGHRGRVRQVKGEREVKVARHGDVYPARVRWWLTDDYFAGVDLVGPFGAQQAIENDTFEALVTIRRRIEPDGWRVAVQGARLDTYPSGMQRDGGVGERIYITRMGEPARETVAMFDPIDPALAVTVDEQFGHWRRWLGSSRRGRA